MDFCTNCGKELSSFTVVCPACGCEVQGRQTAKEKAYLIKNYPIPNTKEDIFEFMMAAVIVDRTGGNSSLMELVGGIVLIASAAGLSKRRATSIDYLISAVSGLLMLWLASMFYNGSLVQLCAGIELIVAAVNYFKNMKQSTK